MSRQARDTRTENSKNLGGDVFAQGEQGLAVVLDQIDWLIAKGYAVFRMTPHGLVTLTRDFKTRSKCLTLLAIKTTAVGYRNGGSASECLDRELAVRKRHFLRHFILKMIVYPRQARDKHRESTQKEMRFPIGYYRCDLEQG